MLFVGADVWAGDASTTGAAPIDEAAARAATPDDVALWLALMDTQTRLLTPSEVRALERAPIGHGSLSVARIVGGACACAR